MFLLRSVQEEEENPREWRGEQVFKVVDEYCQSVPSTVQTKYVRSVDYCITLYLVYWFDFWQLMATELLMVLSCVCDVLAGAHSDMVDPRPIEGSPVVNSVHVVVFVVLWFCLYNHACHCYHTILLQYTTTPQH